MVAQNRSAHLKSSAEVAREWWRRLSAYDFTGAGELLAPDVVVEWPVSGERFRGRANVVAINDAYPGRWRAEIVHCIAEGDRCVTEASVTDGQETKIAVSFFTVRDGLIQTLREFWPEPYPAPEWRRRLIESISRDRAAPRQRNDARTAKGGHSGARKGGHEATHQGTHAGR